MARRDPPPPQPPAAQKAPAGAAGEAVAASSAEAATPPAARDAAGEAATAAPVAQRELAAGVQSLLDHVREVEFEALRRGGAASYAQWSELPALEEGEAVDEPALIEELTQASIPDDTDLPESREERLENTESALPLVLNDAVKKLINYFTVGRGRKTLRLTLGRANAYRGMIERILREEGVPLELLHLCQAETGFRPKARSWARATGLWQFMAFRGKQYGLRQDRYVEERYDPEKATRAAARHLKDLYIEFGDWYLAMAAYNSGPMRVQRAIQRGKTRDYWEMRRRMLLPRETRNYVPIILAMTYIAKNLDLYDLGEIDPAPPLRYDTVDVGSEISLELIADLSGSTMTQIRELNPALLRSATPPYRYALRIPEGAAAEFERELALIPEDKRLDWRRHEVGAGETLSQIAKKYGVEASAIVAHNGLPADAAGEGALEAGRRLTIPAQTRVVSYRSSGGAGGLLEGGTGRYRIARGDTLGGIGRRFGVSVAQLRQWNGLSSTRIRAGRYLIVRPGGVSASAPSGGAPTASYKIRRGDTLGAIARRFGVSVADLQAWNGLTSNLIHVGAVLRVPSLGGESVAEAPAAATDSSGGYISPAENPPAGAGQYRIRSGDTLVGIAGRFGVTVADLKSWNGLRGSRIRAGNYLVVRPPGSAPRTPSLAGKAAKAAPASPAPLTGSLQYRIQRGDNLASIADRHNVSVRDLMAWNGLRSSRIYPGRELVIRDQPAASSAPKAAPASAAAVSPARTGEVRYRIRPGDNLGAIADRYSVSVRDLMAWNGLRGTRIRAGQYLVIRNQPSGAGLDGAGAASARPVASSGAAKYTVRPGDNLASIASRHGVSAPDLMRWNGMASSRIYPGDSLFVRPVPASQLSGAEGQYRIQRGDTLAAIAKRFDVTVDELKAWNGLRGARITAGDSLIVRPPQAGAQRASAGGL